MDISHDDLTGHYMTTKQLGEAIRQAAGLVGHPIDVYGSDACLMTMAEVATEMGDSVSVSVRYEEVEPGEGWPYDGLLRRWTAKAGATAADVGKILAEEYVKSYQGGTQGSREVTFSALDMTKLPALNDSLKLLGQNLMSF